MKKFRVVFTFDKENTRTLTVKAESKEKLLSDITSDRGWFEHFDKYLEVDYLIQLNNVTDVSVKKMK
ncbi:MULTISPECIES: hypothetical protein [Bacillus]|uniref:hypothetical protein n=1 Tax=Bacillus TaxID=1386 RepID=UPI00203E49A5|nr:hypothetical protein [Bacillus safensis]MCM3137345.1 hypothetical protein [Bacillus safensis]UXC31393.1 hypothetical protein N4Q31_12945 [Bacillus safensis]